MEGLKIGLLPLYLELYDRSNPELRKRVDLFHKLISDELRKRGVEVANVPVCRIKPEFVQAIKTFEQEGVDAVVTLHLAYSPSLESADVLAATYLPVIVLDTTLTYDFSPRQDAEEILYNHGIHGVQDMCNMLIRNGKSFQLEAGHWEQSDVLDRVVNCVRVARLAKNMRSVRVGRIGNSFRGMGDFYVPENILHSTIGIEVVGYDFNESRELINKISKDEVKAEIHDDITRFNAEDIDFQAHEWSALAGLVIRRWIEREELTAFSVNFLDISKDSGIPCVPFLEASKAMARGVGYAGEGDVLTAALVGTLLSVYPDTSFVEMFCPDWNNNSIFLSHMGEMNLNLCAEKPRLVKKPFPYTNAYDPIVASGRFKGGKAVFVDLAPGPNNTYTLITAPVEMMDIANDNMGESIRGWFKPQMSISEFLRVYSLMGGTHHGAIVYGDVCNGIEEFGRLMGWKTVRIN